MKPWLALSFPLLLAASCSKTPEVAPEARSAAAEKSAPSPAELSSREKPSAPPRPTPEQPVPCVVTRLEGPVPQELEQGLPLPGGVVTLGEGARVTVDNEFHAARYVVTGPARVMCMDVRLPTLVVLDGVFSLDHAAVGQRAVRVATPASVLTVRAAARVVGKVSLDAGVRIEVVSGSLATSPSAHTLRAGQGLAFRTWDAAPEPLEVPAATLEVRAAALLAGTQGGSRQLTDAARLQAAVVDGAQALETQVDPQRAPDEASLAYRRRLAESAKARIKARQALETDLWRWLAVAAPLDRDGAALWSRGQRAVDGEGVLEGAP